jgi:sulfofructose kinase
MQVEIIGIGLAVLDHLMIVPEFPAREGVVASNQYEVHGGGMVATALVASSLLGASTEFWGRVGADDNGHAILKELKQYGVGTSQIKIVPDGKTGVCFVLVKAGSGERSFVVSRQRNLHVDLTNLNLERIKKAKVLLIDASWVEAAHQAAHYAKSHGIPVVSDIHDPSQPSLDLLSLSDYAIVPRHLADVLASKGDYATALHELKSRGAKVPIITLGKDGCTYLYKGKVYRHPAFPVQVLDTTGAGDCFHGAFCFALSRNLGVPESVTFASAVAALSTTKLGGRAGIPTYEETIEFMQKQGEKV